jgi:hypothetical protein
MNLIPLQENLIDCPVLDKVQLFELVFNLRKSKPTMVRSVSDKSPMILQIGMAKNALGGNSENLVPAKAGFLRRSMTSILRFASQCSGQIFLSC